MGCLLPRSQAAECEAAAAPAPQLLQRVATLGAALERAEAWAECALLSRRRSKEQVRFKVTGCRGLRKPFASRCGV